MKSESVFLAAILVAVLCISGNLFAYSGGDGGPVSPFQIANVADFQQLSTTPLHWSLSFILTANIDLTDLTFAQAPIAPDISTTVGFQGTKFTGNFDGNGHVISNLTITASTQDYIGLFGYVGYLDEISGHIRNLGIEDANITGNHYVGGLVGWNKGEGNEERGTLTSCYATGSVSGTDYVGGLVGQNDHSMLTNCYAAGSASATGGYVGGLVGLNDGLLTDCSASGSVSGTGYVGGLVGQNQYGSLTSCYATGSVSGTEGFVGGLVGEIYVGTLSSCYATGSVSSSETVGGLAGTNFSGLLTTCYATGSVSGTYTSVGGLLGENGGTLTACYATGSVSSGYGDVGGLVGYTWRGSITGCYAIGSISGSENVGGLVGYMEGSSLLTACLWDIQTRSLTDGVGNLDPNPSGVTGLDTATMMMLSTFTSAEWDFSDTDGNAADWMMLREGEDYPRLAWQEIFAGDIAGLYGVNFVDYAEMAAYWGQTGCPTGCEDADINNDGTVDINDLKLLTDNWLKGI